MTERKAKPKASGSSRATKPRRIGDAHETFRISFVHVPETLLWPVFVVVPPLDQLSPGSNEFKTLRNLVTREMSRVLEFANLAANGPQAIELLRPVLLKLKLMHL